MADHKRVLVTINDSRVSVSDCRFSRETKREGKPGRAFEGEKHEDSF